MNISSDQLVTIFEKERPDVVNHLAAQIDIRKSLEDPVSDAHINIIGSLNLLKLCHKYKVKKIVFSSSGGAIYGDQKTYPADETQSTEPQSPYGITKLTVEKYLQFHFWTHGIPFVALRYANVYGPRQNALGEAGVVAIFTKKLLSGEVPTINGDGKQTRDYVYVDDVVHCNVEALKSDVQGIFNVGTGIETDVSTIATKLIQLTGNLNIKPNFGPAKDGEARRSCLKPGKLQKMPPTLLSVGLEKTVQWFKAESKQ
jgi:UDP-glucose 4-epimerase